MLLKLVQQKSHEALRRTFVVFIGLLERLRLLSLVARPHPQRQVRVHGLQEVADDIQMHLGSQDGRDQVHPSKE